MLFRSDKEELTDIQVSKLKEYVLRHTSYNPKLLTNSTKSDLVKIYAWEMYGKTSVGISSYENMSTEKGTIAEGESIRLLSQIDGVNYKKNKRRYYNRYIMGIPDIVFSKSGVRKVIDVKSSLDINTFLCKVDSELSIDYLYQMKGYLELTNADSGEVCFCLVNMPPAIIEQEIKKIKAKYYLYGKSDDETKARIIQLQNSMIFDDIPPERRIIRFPVTRDSDFMANVYERVKVVRAWVKDFHAKHINI